ncbi:MAG: hypothetical protein ACK58L_01865 [Planctomycetota bacterium]
MVASIIASGILLSVESLFGRPGTGESRDALFRLLIDLRALAIRGLEAGVASWFSVTLRMGVFTFLGLLISRFVVNRMCRQMPDCSTKTSATQRSITAAVTVWGLATLLLFPGWMALRLGQWFTSLLAGSFHAGVFSSLPAIFCGVLFLIVSVVVLAAWSLAATSIAAESRDGLEAFSCCLSYCLSRPVRVTCLLALSCGLSHMFGLATAALCDASAALQNARPLESVVHLDGATVQNIADLMGQSLGLSAFMTACSIAYLLIRLVEDGVALSPR